MADDVFSQESQLNARLQGRYHDIAQGVGKCVFCDLREKYIVGEKDGLVLTVNIFPYIDGQMLVIPRRHVESFFELSEAEVMTAHQLMRRGVEMQKRELGIQGVWMILREGEQGSASGKTVKHLHWNILPYVPELNTWHYQTLTITPLDLAARLRKVFDEGA